jgi:hypothetical protein
MGKLKLVLFAFVFTANFCFSQTLIGKIYSATEADQIYGSVNTSVQISSNTLNSLINNTTNYIMFRIYNGNLVILDDQRKVLYPAGTVISPQEEVRMFSASLVKKLLIDGNNSFTTIEIRKNNVLTLTNGIYTLEYSWPCPPHCDGN